MSDKRRVTRKRGNEADQKLTKEEEVIARFVRFNCATKTTIFEGNEVHYFIGNKAIDLLVESKKYGSAAKNPKFVNRVSAVTFMKVLLSKGLFFRARKLVAKRKENKKDAKEKGDTSKSPRKRTKEDAEKESESSKEKKEDEKDSDENEDEDASKKGKKEEDEKKKRKVKLELHQDQQFNDSNDVYVWVFDPTPFHKQLIGALIVLGTIAGCLFPLWPGWLKKGVYYTSLGGLICFGILLGIAFARTVLFVVIWTATMGRHKLWILPNLTEDCGFFESFQPWYTYEYCPDGIKKRKKGEKKKTGEEPQRGFAYYAAMNYTFYCRRNNTKESEKSEKDITKEEGEGKDERGKHNDNGNLEEQGFDEKDISDEYNDSPAYESKDSDENINQAFEEGSENVSTVRKRGKRSDDDFVLIDNN